MKLGRRHCEPASWFDGALEGDVRTLRAIFTEARLEDMQQRVSREGGKSGGSCVHVVTLVADCTQIRSNLEEWVTRQPYAILHRGVHASQPQKPRSTASAELCAGNAAGVFSQRLQRASRCVPLVSASLQAETSPALPRLIKR